MLAFAATSAVAAKASAQGKPSDLHVCVGADRVVRVEPAPTCPTGQTGYRLQLALPGVDVAQTPNDPAARLDDLKRRVDFLTQRMTDLQKDLSTAAQVRAGGKVKAPFEVVDDAGKRIFRVFDEGPAGRGFSVANPSGTNVIFVSALQTAAFFKAKSMNGFPEAVFGVTGSMGAITFRDAPDQSRATLSLTNGKPSLEFANENHVVVANYGQGVTGGGYIQLGNANGQIVVEAMPNAKNCGLVRTLPMGNPGAGLVGMPGNFIMGSC